MDSGSSRLFLKTRTLLQYCCFFLIQKLLHSVLLNLMSWTYLFYVFTFFTTSSVVQVVVLVLRFYWALSHITSVPVHHAQFVLLSRVRPTSSHQMDSFSFLHPPASQSTETSSLVSCSSNKNCKIDPSPSDSALRLFLCCFTNKLKICVKHQQWRQK